MISLALDEQKCRRSDGRGYEGRSASNLKKIYILLQYLFLRTLIDIRGRLIYYGGLVYYYHWKGSK